MPTVTCADSDLKLLKCVSVGMALWYVVKTLNLIILKNTLELRNVVLQFLGYVNKQTTRFYKLVICMHKDRMQI